MTRSSTTGLYTRVSNSFSDPVVGTTISPTDADTYFDDIDSAMNAFIGTSTTSLAIGTGAKTFTVVTPTTKVFLANTYIHAFSLSNSANYMDGTITSYDSATGALITDMFGVGGSGTITDWVIVGAGARGATGPTGPTGAGGILSAIDGSLYNASGTGGVQIPITPQGRLSLTSATPITTSDVTGATTLYYTPATGRYVPIYDGTRFVNTDIAAELSNITTNSAVGKAGPAAVAVSSMYDLFVWSDSGTVRLTRGPAWSSDTSRGTGAGTSEIEQIQGVWVNKVAITNGPAADKGTLVGTVRSDGSSQLKDSVLCRWVSNLYNAVPRAMRVADSTDSWNYTTATWRQANASTANQLDFVQTLAGGILIAKVSSMASNTNTAVPLQVGIGIDRTSGNDASAWAGHNSPAANSICPLGADYVGYPGMGRHYAAWLEYSNATGTATWYGDAGSPGNFQSGMTGWVNN